MRERPSDPTGTDAPDRVRDSGRAGLDDPGRGLDPGTGLSRPEGSEGGATPGDDSRPEESVDQTEREIITSGTAATSEVGDPLAQDAATHRQGGPAEEPDGGSPENV
jgi:hypothetical protein